MRIDEITSLPKYGSAKVPKHVQPPDANDEDVAVMRWYTGHGYSPINAQLRGHKPDFDRDSDELSNNHGIEGMDRVLANAPKRKRALKLFRGESNAEVTKRYIAMEPGQSHTDPGYLSTTFDPSRAFYSFSQLRSHYGGASNAISMYLVPPSVPGAYMHYDGEAIEQEFVLARGCTYTLKDKRTIPVRNKGYSVSEITLLIWDVSYA
jgi:hypothetical protein